MQMSIDTFFLYFNTDILKALFTPKTVYLWEDIMRKKVVPLWGLSAPAPPLAPTPPASLHKKYFMLKSFTPKCVNCGQTNVR